MFIRGLIAAAVLSLIPLMAAGQTIYGPPQYPYGQSTTAGQQLAPRSNVMVWDPGHEGDGTVAATLWQNNSGGGVAIATVELEDDFDAIQLVFANNTSTAYTIGQAAVATSAQWGGGNSPGITPYDIQGNAITAFLPVTFNNGGANSLPWPFTLNAATGTEASSGNWLLALSTSSSTASGNNTLNFTTTNTSLMTNGQAPQADMYVSDGLGCIPANTTISSVTSTTIVMSKNAQGSGCASGQTIFFSFQPITQQSLTVPASTNVPQPQMVFSDWIPISSQPRTDGGFAVGDKVSCGTPCVAGTVVTAVSPLFVTVSPPLGASLTGQSVVSFTETPTTVGTSLTNAFKINLNSVRNIQAGEPVTGSTSIPANTSVTYVGQNYVWISNQLTAPITAGTQLTFTKSGVTNATQSGSTIQFKDTLAKRFLTVRIYTGTGAPLAHKCAYANCSIEQVNLGLPGMVAYTGPVNTDGLNFPANVTNTSSISGNGAMPLFAIRYISRHSGVVIANTGESHEAGDTTVSGNANYWRLAANAISTPNLPVTVINATVGGNSPRVWLPFLYQWLQAESPGIVSIPASTPAGSDPRQVYMSNIQTLSSYARSYGARVVIPSDYVREASSVFNLPVNGAYSGTTVPLLAAVTYNTGSGFQITGPGVPASTTATISCCGLQTITLSQAANIPAGSTLSMGTITATTNGTTAVTLGANSPASGTFNVAGTNIAPSTTITVTGGSTSATLSQNASGSGATTLTLSNTIDTALVNNVFSIAMALSLAAPNSTVTPINLWDTLQDPNNPNQYLLGYSTDGTHANDYGHAVLAAQVKPILQQMIGN